ncbi:folate-binding protein YgfZ [Herbaspirillum sp. RTI4]|uniref:CAF17-like 4Fe-4S cluster assembly/insertion protein YgfZ n=1 Tax=Herbaspirillum sp. RTI4 TaxID=3048640 RepID=UPI002AB531F6|nr:folate-binding protein YgfZ [Herbaspirillum sp. RTI4]MDY7579089.1 folate-binding protein YgfZ [Herbaspirillum sp. RTI4]MEA9981332.1 folate-binding protein YgfZ [Herbaspirillum sp. RTI4]
MLDSSVSPSGWLAFLAQHGAHFDSATPGPALLGFGDDSLVPPSDLLAPLTDLGLLAFSGDDAASFLHNQLTNDVEHLGTNEARLAGYCTPKGRLLASFLIWNSAGTIYLQLPRVMLAAIHKRLQMFVMRSKVKIEDVSDSIVALGVSGTRAAQVLQPWFSDLPASPYDKIDSDSGSLIRLADADGVPRYQWIVTQELAMTAWPALTVELAAAGTSAWLLGDIRAGIPRITPATQEQFVPQMINFELIGGVNFKKGCYPGQEIVARSQYLGKLKRRAALATVAAPNVVAGTEIFSSADTDQPCGMVINAALSTADISSCLVEIKLAACDAGTVHLGSATGPVLNFEPLPYALTEPA